MLKSLIEHATHTANFTGNPGKFDRLFCNSPRFRLRTLGMTLIAMLHWHAGDPADRAPGRASVALLADRLCGYLLGTRKSVSPVVLGPVAKPC